VLKVSRIVYEVVVVYEIGIQSSVTHLKR